MSAMRTFKAQSGKRIFCKNGDIRFKGEFYSTSDKEKIKAIGRAIGVVEVTDTEGGAELAKEQEAKDKANAQLAAEADKKAATDKAANEKAMADVAAAAKLKLDTEADAAKELVEKANAATAANTPNESEDIDFMSAEKCKELLSAAGIGFANNDNVAKLRTMVKAIPA